MILLTGGTGFIGSYLLYYLVKDGQQVRALRRPGSSMKTNEFIVSNLACIENEPSVLAALKAVEWVEGDILDIDSLEEAMEGIDTVYHLAAMVSFSAKDGKKIFHANVDGTANVVNACIEKGIKKLGYLSSIAALARISGKTVDEESKSPKLYFASKYSESKYMAEAEVWRGAAEGLEVVIVNPGIVEGWGDFNRGSAEIFKTIYNGLQFYPSGSNGFVDARDVGKILIQLMKTPAAIGNRYALVSENLSYKTLVNLMAESFKIKPPKYKTGKTLSYIGWLADSFFSFLTRKDPLITKEIANTATRDYSYSNAKIKKLLNYEFIPIKKTIEDVCRVYEGK